MEADKVDKFLLANESKFPDYEIPIHRLLDLPPEKEAILAKNHFKSPICMLSVSCFLGYFGLDRFLIGDWGKGIIKLLTGGGLGIWYIIDWFLIVRTTKRKNMERLKAIPDGLREHLSIHRICGTKQESSQEQSTVRFPVHFI